MKPINEHMPAEFEPFSQEYLDDNGRFTETGQSKYLDDIAGYVSYLNREKDARQFAQPVIQNVSIPLVSNEIPIQRFDKRAVRSYLETPIGELKKQIIEENKNIDADLKDLTADKFGFLLKKCEDSEGTDSESASRMPSKKKCTKVVKENIRKLVEEAKSHVKIIKDKITAIREDIKNKNLFKNESLKSIGENIENDQAAFAQFKTTPYYNIKYNCGKKIKTNVELVEALQTYEPISEINEEIAILDARIDDAQQKLKVEMTAFQSRIKRLSEMMKTDLSDLEKSVIRMTIRDERKTMKRVMSAKKKQLLVETNALNASKKVAESTKSKKTRKIKKN